MINSPLNYPGNKSRIASKIIDYFPSKINTFYDLFAGSAIVSMNVDANKYCINDISDEAISLLKYFRSNEPYKIINDIDNIIEQYNLTNTFKNGKEKYPIFKNEGLSNYNREGYLNLRDDYNKNQTIDKLFALIIFGFNHYIRYNSKKEFNIPVGKVDYNYKLREKTVNTSERLKKMNITFSKFDFSSDFLYSKMSSDDLVYLDPPYFITDAPYNQGWSEDDENRLYTFLDKLNKKNIRFALSNVVESNGKKNKILEKWMANYNVIYIDRKYLNSNYRKKNLSNAIEVLITNY